jgi:PhzF family phenazine biosynthesis protein
MFFICDFVYNICRKYIINLFSLSEITHLRKECMLQVPIFQVDAFSKTLFSGNPAAVLILQEFPPDSKLQKIAAENNLAETAFLVPDGEGYNLRWFTPTVEVPLCGHATLASAAVILEKVRPELHEITFATASGPLKVTRADGRYVMNFPSRPVQPAPMPENILEVIGVAPTDFCWDGFNFLACLSSAETVRNLIPDFAKIRALGSHGLIVTARGDEIYDFVSRYFAPAKGIPEDPVTGGAHCALAPYWAQRLGKTSLVAWQASSRGGEVRCQLIGERVEIEGTCVFYLEGLANI